VRFDDQLVNKKSRELSREIFGYSNTPVIVKVNDFSKFFGEYLDPTAVTRDDVDMLRINFPFIVNMLDKKSLPPPLPPSSEDLVAVEVFLKESRLYRKMTPTVDRLSKCHSGRLAADSTRTKFDLGISTAGCLHVGAGKITASSVPNASKYVDWMMGSELFDTEVPPGTMLVSDAAIPSEDGLGCGYYPQLVSYLEDVARDGNPIIAIVVLGDLDWLTYPYHILFKPRAHNMEAIISMNIPGVSIDRSEIIKKAINDNNWRNKCCYEESIDEIEIDDISFDFDLLVDNKDYTTLLSDLPSVVLAPLMKRVKKIESERDPNKFESLVDAGFLLHADNVNFNHVKRSFATMARVNIHASMDAKDGNDYLYHGRHMTSGFRKNVTRAHGRRPAEYPTAMWFDLFPSMREGELATFVNTLEMLRNETVTYIKEQKEIRWKDLKLAAGKKKGRYKTPSAHRQ
jgi:hypothetical protein